MNTIIQTLDELFTLKVQEATQSVLNDLVRKIEQQQKEISGLKEENRMIRTLLKSYGLKVAPAKMVRTSAYDICNFRKSLGISQEVFAFLLDVDRRTIIRWEKGRCLPPSKQKQLLIALKSMSRKDLAQKIKAATDTLYH